ncbi:MAG: outer membrane beta-barrel protein [Deltaproteobacteria bacterium]|nr:outer membrane beta-barrel protein [Deltaproteobacteria bacterium]
MRIFCLLCTLLSFLLALSPASAIEFEEIPGNIHIGPLEIHPKIDIKEEYNDNIFREARGESGSAITTISPGLVLQLPIQRHFLEIDYHSDLIEASRFHRVYDTDSHFVDVLFNLDFNRLGFLVGNNFASDSTPPDYKTDIRNNYIQNRFYIDTSYKLAGRYMLEGFYRNEFRDFDSFRKPGDFDPELDNYRQYEAGFDLFYRFRPVTSLLFEYAFTHRENEDKRFPSTDSEAHRFWLGLKWEPTAKIAGVIKGGYVTYDYEGISDDWDGFGLQTDLEYKISPYYFLRLTGFRKLLETSVTREEGWYGTYYISTGGILQLRHIFTYKISAFIRAFYYNDDYTERGLIGRRRNDDRFGCGCGATYQIQEWLGCSLQYNYVDNDSNISVEDYKANLIEGLVSFTF